MADGPTRAVVADEYAIVRQGIAHVVNDDERVQVVGEAADGVKLRGAV